jgi:NTP pyrophosphatase (non-canonical NTP hydrolase)
MAQFKKTGTIADFQKFIKEVYSLPDDRLYSIWDILTQQQRFTMRALKGIRKGNVDKVKVNLMVAFSWLMAIVNRLHINIEEEVWNRFPYLCSYCGKLPCACKSIKSAERAVVKADNTKRPHGLAAFQKMFSEIYPAAGRTPEAAGVHLAEEMGEVSEAIHNYLGQHLQKQFHEVRIELADFVSCVLGLANSLNIDVAKELEAMYSDNCHVCHEAPCVCSFSEVAALKS